MLLRTSSPVNVCNGLQDCVEHRLVFLETKHLVDGAHCRIAPKKQKYKFSPKKGCNRSLTTRIENSRRI